MFTVVGEQAAEARLEAKRLAALGGAIFAPYETDDMDADGAEEVEEDVVMGAVSQWIHNVDRDELHSRSRGRRASEHTMQKVRYV